MIKRVYRLFIVTVIGFLCSYQMFSQATQLSFVGIPNTGYANTNLADFKVQAVNSLGVVDSTYNGLITISEVSGSGTLGGIDTATAIYGSATFGHITLSAPGNYVLAANSGSLIPVSSSSIVISAFKSFGTPSKLIYFWDFNQTLPNSGQGGDSLGTAQNPLLPNYSATAANAQIRYYRPQKLIGTALVRDSILDNDGPGGSYLYDYSAKKYPYFTSSDSNQAEVNAFIRARNPSDSSYFYLTMPSKGYQNLNLNFALSGSSASMANYLIFSYSSNNGLTWNNLSASMDTFNIHGIHRQDTLSAQNPTTTKGKWYAVGLNFSSASAINDNPNFIVRFMLSGSTSQGTSGNTRFDNFALTGDSICPSIVATTSSAAACIGANALFTAKVIGGMGNATYQWQVNTGSGFTNIANGGIYAGATTDTLKITGVTSAMNQNQYRLQLTAGICGTITGSTGLLIVNPNPNVTATSTPPTVCAGGSAVPSGANAKTYTWSSGLLNQVSFTPAKTGTYTVTATDANGCVNTATLTIPVYSLPIVKANASAAIVCQGTSVQLVGSGAKTYSWTNNVVNDSAFVPLITQSYTVTGTDSNGCKATANISVTVDTLPHITAHANATVVCQGTGITLTGSGGISYSWSGNVTNGTVFKVPAGQLTYTVTGTASNGCTNTSTVAILSNPNPIVTAYSSASNVCAGDSALVYATGASTYVWSSGIKDSVKFLPTSSQTYTVIGTDVNGCTAMSNTHIGYNLLPGVLANASLTELCQGMNTLLYGSGAATYTWSSNIIDSVLFTPTATHTYTVTGTGTNGCKALDSITVIVDSLPKVITGGYKVICAGKSVPIGGTINKTYSYTWSPSTDLSCASCSNPTANPIQTQLYTLNVSNNATGCFNSDTVSVKVMSSPKISAAAIPDTICFGNSLLLQGQGGQTYSWSGGAIDGIPFSPTSSGTYTVTSSNAFGCVGTSTVAITVNALPMVSIKASNIEICSGLPVTLTGEGALTYVWSPAISNAQPFMPYSTQTYTVTGTNAKGCSDTSSITVAVTICTGIATTTENASISIYPNPSNGMIKIGQVVKQYNVFLYNSIGALISSTIVTPSNTSIDFRGIPEGVYLINLIPIDGSVPVHQKIIIHQ